MITVMPSPSRKIPAILRFHAHGPFKAGDKFDVAAVAGRLFKAQCFRSIEHNDSFSLHQAKVGLEEQVSGGPLPMIMFCSSHAEFSWPTCVAGQEIRLFVEATTDVDGFACELEGVTVRDPRDSGERAVDVTVQPGSRT